MKLGFYYCDNLAIRPQNMKEFIMPVVKTPNNPSNCKNNSKASNRKDEKIEINTTMTEINVINYET